MVAVSERGCKLSTLGNSHIHCPRKRRSRNSPLRARRLPFKCFLHDVHTPCILIRTIFNTFPRVFHQLLGFFPQLFDAEFGACLHRTECRARGVAQSVRLLGLYLRLHSRSAIFSSCRVTACTTSYLEGIQPPPRLSSSSPSKFSIRSGSACP